MNRNIHPLSIGTTTDAKRQFTSLQRHIRLHRRHDQTGVGKHNVMGNNVVLYARTHACMHVNINLFVKL